MILNSGNDSDIAIIDLARLISGDNADISLVEHPHPDSEIPKLLCNSSRARKLLNWEPQTPLSEGVDKLKEWSRCRMNINKSQTAKSVSDR
jgi:UDP-glucose 4-epimerase